MRMTKPLASALAAIWSTSVACHRDAPVVECSPGGRCAAVADSALAGPTAVLALSDLRAPRGDSVREVRVWQVYWPSKSGWLARFVGGAGSGVSAEHFEWWRVGDRTTKRRQASGGGPYCEGRPRTARGVKACRVGASAPPYAGNILRNLDAHGLRTLRGGGLPVLDDTVPACTGDECGGPAALIVEIRDGRQYRSYGYTLRLGSDSASRPALILWRQLQFASIR